MFHTDRTAGSEPDHPRRECVRAWRWARSCGWPTCPRTCRRSAPADSSSACSDRRGTFSTALYQYPGGWLADRVGRRRALLIFTALAIAGYAVYASAPSWPVMFVGLLGVMAWKAGGVSHDVRRHRRLAAARAPRDGVQRAVGPRARAPRDRRADRRRPDREPRRDRGRPHHAARHARARIGRPDIAAVRLPRGPAVLARNPMPVVFARSLSPCHPSSSVCSSPTVSSASVKAWRPPSSSCSSCRSVTCRRRTTVCSTPCSRPSRSPATCPEGASPIEPAAARSSRSPSCSSPSSLSRCAAPQLTPRSWPPSASAGSRKSGNRRASR